MEGSGRNPDTRTLHRYSGHMSDQWAEGRVYVLIIVLTCPDTVNLKYNLLKIMPIMGYFLWVGIFVDYW